MSTRKNAQLPTIGRERLTAAMLSGQAPEDATLRPTPPVQPALLRASHRYAI
jgi:hypothetical protein